MSHGRHPQSRCPSHVTETWRGAEVLYQEVGGVLCLTSRPLLTLRDQDQQSASDL